MCDFTDSTKGNTCFYWLSIVNFIFVWGGHPSKQKSIRFLLAQVLPGGELPSFSKGEGFFEIHGSANTRGARTDPQISTSVNTLPSQSVTWNGKSQMHSFWSQRFFGGSHFWSLREFGSLLARKTAAFPHVLLLSKLAVSLTVTVNGRRWTRILTVSWNEKTLCLQLFYSERIPRFLRQSTLANFDSLLERKNTLFTGVFIRKKSTISATVNRQPQ